MMLEIGKVYETRITHRSYAPIEQLGPSSSEYRCVMLGGPEKRHAAQVGDICVWSDYAFSHASKRDMTPEENAIVMRILLIGE